MSQAACDHIASSPILAVASVTRYDDPALEYLRREIGAYLEQPEHPEDAHDAGYREALTDMLRIVYGMRVAAVPVLVTNFGWR